MALYIFVSKPNHVHFCPDNSTSAMHQVKFCTLVSFKIPESFEGFLFRPHTAHVFNGLDQNTLKQSQCDALIHLNHSCSFVLFESLQLAGISEALDFLAW